MVLHDNGHKQLGNLNLKVKNITNENHYFEAFKMQCNNTIY